MFCLLTIVSSCWWVEMAKRITRFLLTSIMERKHHRILNYKGGEKKLQRGVCRSHIVGWWSFVFPWHTELNISEHSEELKGREKKLWKSQHKTGFLHTFLAVFSLMWRRTVWSWGQISGNFKCAIKCAPWPFFFSLNTLSISTIFLRCDTCRNPKHYKNSWTPSISRSG